MVSSDVVFLGSMLSQARHFLCSEQDIPCVPSRTRLKNREDGSDFDNFWTKTIAAAQFFFFENFRAAESFVSSKNLRDERRWESALKSDGSHHYVRTLRMYVRTYVRAFSLPPCFKHSFDVSSLAAKFGSYVRTYVRTHVRTYVKGRESPGNGSFSQFCLFVFFGRWIVCLFVRLFIHLATRH